MESLRSHHWELQHSGICAGIQTGAPHTACSPCCLQQLSGRLGKEYSLAVHLKPGVVTMAMANHMNVPRVPGACLLLPVDLACLESKGAGDVILKRSLPGAEAKRNSAGIQTGFFKSCLVIMLAPTVIRLHRAKRQAGQLTWSTGQSPQ